MAENKKTITYAIDEDHDRAPSSGSTKYTISSADIDLFVLAIGTNSFFSIESEYTRGMSIESPFDFLAGLAVASITFF